MAYYYEGKQVCRCCENCINGSKVSAIGLHRTVRCFNDNSDRHPLDSCQQWDFSESKFNCETE